jgi:hypothetical protein
MKTSSIKLWLAGCTAGVVLAAPVSGRADQPDANAPPAKCYTGRVTAFYPQDHVLCVKEYWLLPARRFNLGDNCVYNVPGRNPGTMNDLRPGEKVRVSYRDVNGVLIAGQVEQQPMQVEGTVAEIDPGSHQLALRGFAYAKPMEIAGDCAVVLRGDKTGTLADIRPGDYVTVTYETPDHRATARQIAQTSLEYTGALTGIDLTERTVKAGSKTFQLGDNCAIVAGGKTNAGLRDLLNDMRPHEDITINYDDINGVNVANRIAPAPVQGQSSYVGRPQAGSGLMWGY